MDDSRTEEYLRLLAQNERSIAAYVHGLVSHRTDAEEILQEAKVVMWKKFGDFEKGSHFPAWARKIALGLILNYRRSSRRRRSSPMEETFIEAVAAEMDRLDENGDFRREALERCLAKLPETHRRMILWRYFDEKGINTIADETRRTEGAVYRMLSRIRKALHQCIERELDRGVGA